MLFRSLWDTETHKLLPDVREALLNIYNDFLKSNFTDNSVTIPVVDLHLLGSQAGYNYTEHSDIDLHLLVNFELLYEKDEVLQLLYQTVTRKFNSDLDITVKGIPVELYIQDLKSVNKSTGVYSVFEDRWIQEPGQPPEISQETLETANEIANELIAATQAVLDNKNQVTFADVEKLINDIYIVRKQSLTEFNEFSAGNLAFKILRNTGLLDEVKELHKELRGEELSLAEQNSSQVLKEDHCLECGEQVDHDERICPYCGSSEIHRTEDDIPSEDESNIEEPSNIKHLYKFVASNGYVYKDKRGKTVFSMTEEEAKRSAHFKNEKAKEKGYNSVGYKPYLAEEKKTMKCTIKRLTEETKKKRISSYKEFDNGRVLHHWTEMTDEEAQEIARKESIKYPDDIFYVAYDDVMDSDSDIRWVNGKQYNYDEVQMRGDKPMIKEKLREDKDQDDILSLLDKLQKKAENIDFDYYRSELNLTEVIELINKLRNNYKSKEKLEEDVDSQETYADTSVAANLTALVNSEIEAINLYTSVLETCTCEKTKVVLEEILQDEKDHINLLSNLIDSLVSEAFPSDETVEEITQKAGMNPVPDEAVDNTSAVVAVLEDPETAPMIALNEDILDKSNVDELIQDYRENAFGYDDIRDYVETQYPMHKPEVKDKLVELMSKRLTEDVDEETEAEVEVTEGEDKTEDAEQVANDLMDEVKAMGYEVEDDTTFTVTGSESGYTATVSVISNNSFSVMVAEPNGDILESLDFTDKNELFDYLKLLNSENEDLSDEALEYEEE